MTMTRKHYAAVASVLKNNLEGTTTRREMELVSRIARSLAWEFSQDSGNFRFNTFYEACGLDASGWAEWVEVSSDTIGKGTLR